MIRIAQLTKEMSLTSIGLSSFSLRGSLILTSRSMIFIVNTLIQLTPIGKSSFITPLLTQLTVFNVANKLSIDD